MPAGAIKVPQIIPLRQPYGNKKHVIDSNTEIDIRIENRDPDVQLYYTLNNKRPNPFQVFGSKYTYKFEFPFTLSPGKRTIKVMAVSRDGSKESLVVTRTFLVHEGGERDREDSEEEYGTQSVLDLSLSRQFRQRLRLSSRESVYTPSSTPPPPPPTPPPPSFLSRPSTPTLTKPNTNTTTTTPIAAPHKPYPSIKCLYCQCIANINGQVYCTNCGSELPKLPIVNEDPTRLLVCPNCHTEVTPNNNDSIGHPANNDNTANRHSAITSNVVSPNGHSTISKDASNRLPTNRSLTTIGHSNSVDITTTNGQYTNASGICHVCDSPLQPLPELPSLHVQVMKDVTDLIPCLHCGMRNNPSLTICTTCDQPLLRKHETHPLIPGQPRETIMHPINGSTFVMCGTCGRVNVSDARFCDWCGCKPLGSGMELLCQSCNTGNDWQCRFCYKCGQVMKCPLRPEVESGATLQMPKTAAVNIDRHQWIPVADILIHHEDKSVTAWPETYSKGTQTQGLFYPSEKTITTKKQCENWQRLMKKVSKDRLVQLSTYSPGRGLWRAQLEHIITHLKAHSSTCYEFQESVGSHQLGKLISSTVNEEGDSEVSINLTFAIKGDMDTTGYQNHSLLKKLKRKSLTDTNRGGVGGVTLIDKRRRTSSASSTIFKVENHLLSSELAFTGQGRADIVTSLLEKGANVNSIDTGSGLPMLLLAASNGHLEAMNILIEKGGANIDIQTKRTGRTALHEAVSIGTSRKNIILSLLNHGANPTIKDRDNLTPCELANKLGHKQLTLLFANQLGSTMLGKLLPPQSIN